MRERVRRWVGENINAKSQIWSDGQKPYMRLCMRVRLHIKSKPNNYTESCMINEADGWRGRNVWYLGEVCAVRLERGNHCIKAMLNAQKSAEVIVAER